MECSLCKQIKQPTKDNKATCISCDVCKRPICLECSELSPTEIRCLNLQKRILQYKCKQCRYEAVEILQNTIKDKDKIIELLQEKVKNLEQNQMDTHTNTYANAAKSPIETIRHNVPKIIVKPKQRQNVSETKTDIKNIDLAEINVGIKSIQARDTGTLVIKCETETQIKKLLETAKKQFENKYEIKLSKMRNPKIKIPNFRQAMTAEEIQRSIDGQNNISGLVTISYIKANKNGSKTIFCDCCSIAFKAIMEMGKINIGWERYSAFEDLSVLRCFKCQGYNHKVKDCKSDVVCLLCSGSHEQDKCTSNKKCCKNCKFANDKYKKDYNIEHSPTDPNCPSLIYYIEILKSNTNY